MEGPPRRLAEALQGLPGSTVGSRIGPYLIEEELARGGYGVVFRAVHTELGRPAALKVLIAGAEARARHKARFLREAQLAASIEHPGIVRILDRGEEDGLLYLAMELVEGRTLKSVFHPEEGSDLTQREARLELLVEVADALEAAHAAGIVHRDLKPDNVLIRDDGRPVVTDFGLARDLSLTSDLTQTGVMVGTPTHMAPEQVVGRPATPASDVYALGVMLYEALTGEVPFWDAMTSPHAAYAAVVEEPPPRPSARVPGLPRGFDLLVGAAMAKAPADRPATAGAFAEALRAAIAGRRPELPIRDRTARPLVVAGAVALVVAGAGLGVVVGRSAQPAPPVASASPTPAPTISPSTAAPTPIGLSPTAAPTPGPLTRRAVRVAPGWATAEGLTEAELERTLEAQRRARRVLTHLAVSDGPGGPRFHAAWRASRVGAPYRVGRTGKQYGADFRLLRGKNKYRPDRIVLYRRGGEVAYVATWASERSYWTSWSALQGPEAWRRKDAFCRSEKKAGPAWIGAVVRPGKLPLLAGVWLADKTSRRAEVELSAAQLDRRWLASRMEGYRLMCLAPYGDRFAAAWARGSHIDVSFHRVSAAEHRAVLEAMRGQGLFPQVLVAHPGGRYTTAWTRSVTGQELQRTGRPQGAFASVDVVVEKVLRQSEISRAVVAITRGSRLVYLRGYTHGPPEMTPTAVDARFRLVDATRVVTAATALRLVEAGRLRLDQPAAELLPKVAAAQRAAGAGAAFAQVTLRHLLQGSVPWRGETQARAAARKAGLTFTRYIAREQQQARLPLRRADVVDFVGRAFRVQRGSGKKPGSSRRLSYLLVARALERAGGAPFSGLVQRLVAAPVGARGFAPAGTRIGERAPGEVVYEGRSHRADGTGGGAAMLPFQYGGWSLRSRDAAVGWLGSAVDVAKLLAALQPQARRPLLGAEARAAMFARGPGGKRVALSLGWKMALQGSPRHWVSGTMTGSSALAMMLPGGVGVVFLTNRGRLPESLPAELASVIAGVGTWPQVDLFDAQGGR